jgi:hypothetical protein
LIVRKGTILIAAVSGGIDMKKILVSLIFFLIAGCGHLADESEFWKHDTMYASWGHMRFSMGGCNQANSDDFKKSQKEGWWGIPIVVKDCKGDCP